jgi:hypothetical protein
MRVCSTKGASGTGIAGKTWLQMLRVFMALYEYWDRNLFTADWKEGNYAALAAFMEVWSGEIPQRSNVPGW